jgi:hypothetical protein
VPACVEVEHLDAVRFSRAVLCSELETAPAMRSRWRQRVDEIGHRGTGADADDHAVLDVFDGLHGGQALRFAWVQHSCIPGKAAISTARR